MTYPFNRAAHLHLLEMGYTYTRYEEEFGDNGNGESGPMPWYTPAWDCYDSDEDYIPITHDGRVEAPMQQQPEPPEGWDEDPMGDWMGRNE